VIINPKDNVIYKKICDMCGGTGHAKGCKCVGALAFIVGCCSECRGEGTVVITKEEYEGRDGKASLSS